MPESRDYYRGAIEALEHVENQPVHSNVKLTVLRFRLDEYRRKLATLPPADPAPDPSPCQDCAEVWKTLDNFEAAMNTLMRELNAIADGKQEEIRNDSTAGESYGWRMAVDHSEEIMKPALALVAATRQKRGA